MNKETGIRENKEAMRVEMFSDAVFAIAITLLVLELIQILHPQTDLGLFETFIHHWHSFVAFFIGFITILICWINHHVAFEFIDKVDTRFLWINGSLLFVVTLTPFPTAILAEYLEKESNVALAMFGFNYILISLAAYGICAYAYKNNLVIEKDRTFFQAYTRIYYYAIYYTILAFLLCFFTVWIPIIMYVILFSFFAAPKELTRRIDNLKKGRKKKITLARK